MNKWSCQRQILPLVTALSFLFLLFHVTSYANIYLLSRSILSIEYCLSAQQSGSIHPSCIAHVCCLWYLSSSNSKPSLSPPHPAPDHPIHMSTWLETIGHHSNRFNYTNISLQLPKQSREYTLVEEAKITVQVQWRAPKSDEENRRHVIYTEFEDIIKK